jgi:hypothetical protein
VLKEATGPSVELEGREALEEGDSGGVEETLWFLLPWVWDWALSLAAAVVVLAVDLL